MFDISINTMIERTIGYRIETAMSIGKGGVVLK